MKRVKGLVIFFLLVGMCGYCRASDPAAAPSTSEGWKLDSQAGNISLYARPRPNSSLKEFKGIGEIEAPVRAVHAVIDDLENYTSFMPFTVECRIIKREGGATFFYQRLSPKVVSDRDYTLRVSEKSWRGKSGSVQLHRFDIANEVGPPEVKGFTRVNICNGGWLLEPIDANRTRAMYSIDTDNGGKVPAFIANPASAMAIRKLFAAVRKQVKESKYTVAER